MPPLHGGGQTVTALQRLDFEPAGMLRCCYEEIGELGHPTRVTVRKGEPLPRSPQGHFWQFVTATLNPVTAAIQGFDQPATRRQP